MFEQQNWQMDWKDPPLRRALFFLIVLGLFSLIPAAHAEQGFTEESIQGTWVFLATGMRSTDQPFALRVFLPLRKPTSVLWRLPSMQEGQVGTQSLKYVLSV